MSTRAVQESPIVQGEDEIITYDLTTTPWGSSPTNVTVKVYDITDGAETDVTTTIIPTGEASVSAMNGPSQIQRADSVMYAKQRFAMTRPALPSRRIL